MLNTLRAKLASVYYGWRMIAPFLVRYNVVD